MSDDATDEKCFGCDAIMPSFLECCPSCGWERSPEISREARLRAMGGGKVPAYIKVLFIVVPIIAVVVAGINVAVGPNDAIILKKPPPIPAKRFWEGRLARSRRLELEAQWDRYNAQQKRLSQAKAENGNATK